jgi:hypothetical protein
MVPPSPNQFGRQQVCRLKCLIGFPQQVSTHRHEILCQQDTSQPDVAYAQEASTFAIHCNTIAYGQKTQHTPEEDTLAPLLPERLKRVQKIIRSLMYYAQAVDNKLLVALNAISTGQAKATIHMEQIVDTLLNYIATYPNNGIVYRASEMVICMHADAGYLNKT